VPRSASDLKQWIDQWLNIAQRDGTYAALSQKYLGAVIGP
jgi:cyclohexadienyl dehydratase